MPLVVRLFAQLANNIYNEIGNSFQENILLDEDKNIKLIDFGLCAKPDVSVPGILLYGILANVIPHGLVITEANNF